MSKRVDSTKKRVKNISFDPVSRYMVMITIITVIELRQLKKSSCFATMVLQLMISNVAQLLC